MSKSLENNQNPVHNIYLFGPIKYESAKPVVEQINIANQNPKVESILLTICSGGGDFYPAFAIFDSIKNSRIPVDILISGWAASCAVMITQAARIRKCTQNSYIMIHPSLNVVPTAMTHQEFMVDSNQYNFEHARFIELSSSRCGLSTDKFDQLCKKEMRVYMTPQEALEFGTKGLIDEIVGK